ncbi:S9 family peptidase [Osmerus mordax]|uniref:S9 family peptidase n=1 Tax=Osmerus mordax TaxID=8014 RepID=UPI0035107C8E
MESLMESDAIAAVYDQCSGYPTPLSANVTEALKNNQRIITVSTEWCQNETSRRARLRFSQSWTLIGPDGPKTAETPIFTVPPSGPCTPLHGELLSNHSPSGDLRAVVRDASGHQYLEVWDGRGLRTSLDLTGLNKHGRVYEDAQFGCLAWSECERRVLYVAEASRGTTEAPASMASSSTGASTAREHLLAGKDRSVYWEDWGEGLAGKSLPVLCVADLVKGSISVLQGVPSDVSPGQPLWARGGQAVVFVGWFHEPFRLGLKFCSNRRSALYCLDLEGTCECLSGGASSSVSSPRLSPDGSWLVYLQGQVWGPHSQALSLQLHHLDTGRSSELLEVVHRPRTGPDRCEFAGLYEALPACCWSEDGHRVVFTSSMRNWKEVYVVDRLTRRVTSLSSSVDFGSWKLLTIQRDLMVVSCSSPNRPPCLRVAYLAPHGGEGARVLWKTLGEPGTILDLDWNVMDITPPPQEENPQYSGLMFSCLLVRPRARRSASKTPLVVFSHGGPHSQFHAEWNVTSAALAKLGFAVLMVNYRGSTGFGQDSILSLIGRIGDQDVKDVQRAVLTALQSDLTLDPKKLLLMGGSHGGFLSCHLIGQYPDFYRACAARNPVINAATLLGTSDIVDWRYSCVGLQYSYDKLPSPQALANMLEKSPIRHAAQISTPVLLLLGGRDRRVSPHQGLELYRHLKSRGSPVRLLWFAEEGHSLAGVITQADCFLNMVLWFQQHLT